MAVRCEQEHHRIRTRHCTSYADPQPGLRERCQSRASRTFRSTHYTPIDHIPVHQTFAQQILDFQLSADAAYTLPATVADAVESIWADPIIATVLDNSTEFYLMDSAPYFFGEVRRICDAKYIPNEDDVLRSRAKTTGITETRFHMGQLSIQYVKFAVVRGSICPF